MCFSLFSTVTYLTPCSLSHTSLAKQSFNKVQYEKNKNMSFTIQMRLMRITDLTTLKHTYTHMHTSTHMHSHVHTNMILHIPRTRAICPCQINALKLFVQKWHFTESMQDVLMLHCALLLYEVHMKSKRAYCLTIEKKNSSPFFFT